MRLKLIHHPICPHSRFVRLALYEYNLPVGLIGERIWERREEFLKLNPAGTLPVLLVEGQSPVPGAGIIAEYLADVQGKDFSGPSLLPGEFFARIETRRLMCWFNDKFFADVSGPLTAERYKQYIPPDAGGGSPNYTVIRAAREDILPHLAYIDLLVNRHDWLTGDQLTYADLAAAAHLSVVDNLDDLCWTEAETAKTWLARVQSRRSFRLLLSEGWKGFVQH
jgi:glutathione S-transferase